jgi:OOP family OmpA-OmpF porin
MRTTPFIFTVLGATLLSAGVMTAHAQEGYYDPSNVGSPTGKTIGHELYRTIGCPGQGLLGSPCKVPDPDTDGDGVRDSKDKCPGTPAGRKVNADGCELDSDGDGLVDGVDKCPSVYAKTADGCPLPVAAPPAPAPAPAPAPVPAKMVLEGVNFDYDKATLRPEDLAIIDADAATLEKWGDVKVEVAGHTDSRGSDEYNLNLSQQRAEAVRNYLISKGVAADRLTAKGYGESQPVADNETDEGRLKNRRVELVPLK